MNAQCHGRRSDRRQRNEARLVVTRAVAARNSSIVVSVKIKFRKKMIQRIKPAADRVIDSEK